MLFAEFTTIKTSELIPCLISREKCFGISIAAFTRPESTAFRKSSSVENSSMISNRSESSNIRAKFRLSFD